MLSHTTQTHTRHLRWLACTACAACALLVHLPGALADDGPEAGPAPQARPGKAGPLDQAQRLGHMWDHIREQLERAADERQPQLSPPQPTAVRWQARRISSVDLGAPLLALESGDLDGDGRAELIALTTREVILIERRSRRRLDLRTRIALPAEPASVRPRDPVGAVLVSDVDGDGRAEVLARSSDRKHTAIYSYHDGGLIERGTQPGFPLCQQVAGELQTGRNYFVSAARHVVPLALEPLPVASPPPGPAPPTPPVSAPPPDPAPPRSWAPAMDPASAFATAFETNLPKPFFAARCRHDMVDPLGRPLAVVGIVGNDGTLHLWADRACPRRDDTCRLDRLRTRTLADNGTAFAIGDVDRDGHPEVVVTSDVPPGEPDRVTVLSWREGRLRRLFQRGFSGGVVGLTAGDIDSDGALEVLAAVRLLGSHRVDIWVLNR